MEQSITCAALGFLMVAAASCSTPSSIDLSDFWVYGHNSDGSCAEPTHIPTQTILPGATALGSAAFSGGLFHVRSSTKVGWFNSDSVTHEIAIDSLSRNTGVILPGETAYIQLPSVTGRFTFHCAIHPAMANVMEIF